MYVPGNERGGTRPNETEHEPPRRVGDDRLLLFALALPLTCSLQPQEEVDNLLHSVAGVPCLREVSRETFLLCVRCSLRLARVLVPGTDEAGGT